MLMLLYVFEEWLADTKILFSRTKWWMSSKLEELHRIMADR